MPRRYYVYILASRAFGPIYIGMTNDPVSRIIEHGEGRGSKHVTKYKIFRLVYIEDHVMAADAIKREQSLKRWRRAWKDEMIERDNPNWHDLFDNLKTDLMLD